VLGGIPPLTRGGFDALSEPYYECRADTRMKMAVLRSFLRPRAPDIPMAALTTFLTSTPKGPEKFATILSREAKQLLAMDRYEHRLGVESCLLCRSRHSDPAVKWACWDCPAEC
jgi:hypothetical protein